MSARLLFLCVGGVHTHLVSKGLAFILLAYRPVRRMFGHSLFRRADWRRRNGGQRLPHSKTLLQTELLKA